MATLKEVAQVAVEARRDKGSGSGRRLREIERILRQHRVLSGLTPEKATSLLEDLGPTFVKMGQIAANRSDVIPPAYADAFKRLRADVPPMPFSTVLATIEESLGHPWRGTFSCIEEKPLGSASIAQVHRARIAPHAVGDAGAGTGAAAVPLPADAPKAGSYVAIKVRRPHVVEQMTQDLALIRQAVALVGLTRATDGIKLSLDDLVTELERTTRQELDFCVEQHNLVRFRQFLDDQPGVESPRPYPHLSSDDVLVMDFVEGPMINDVPALRAMGLDPAKLGQRLAESFVTQIVDNGFFHADPHPGNILVRDGDVVWIDLGMVGTLTMSERMLVGKVFTAVATDNAYLLKEAVMGLVHVLGPVDHGALLESLSRLLAEYSTAEMKEINVGTVLTEVIEVLRELDDDHPTVHYVYVLNDYDEFVGVLSLRTLVLTDDAKPVGDVMYEDVISVPPDETEEDVAADIFKYELPAMPVVDEHGVLLGIVTVDDAWDAIEEDVSGDKTKATLLKVLGGLVASILFLALYTLVLLQVIGYTGR